MSNSITFGTVGSIIGALWGLISKLLTPDGSECLYLFTQLPNSGLWLTGFINCWVGSVLVWTIIIGAIGTAVGAIFGD